MAQGFCGEYRLREGTAKPNGARFDLSADHKFQIVDFPEGYLPAFGLAGEKVRNCKGAWRAASDDGSLIAQLVVTEVNGRPANESLIFRYGSVALLISPPNNQIAEFVRDR